MDLLIEYAVSALCLAISFFFYWCQWTVNRDCIDEIGYRSRNNRLKRKKRKKGQPWWDYLFHLTLCRGAKQNQRIVWIYFGINLIVCVVEVASVVLFLCCPVWTDLRNCIIYQLGFAMDVVLVHTWIHFFLDLKYVPSVQKRYRFIVKQKEKP